MLIIPLSPIPSQTLDVTLAGQYCSIAVYQKSTGVFIDLTVTGTPILSTVLCYNRVRIVREPYLGFIGDLMFLDMQEPEADPDYTGFGARWQLCYLEASDL